MFFFLTENVKFYSNSQYKKCVKFQIINLGFKSKHEQYDKIVHKPTFNAGNEVYLKAENFGMMDDKTSANSKELVHYLTNGPFQIVGLSSEKVAERNSTHSFQQKENKRCTTFTTFTNRLKPHSLCNGEGLRPTFKSGKLFFAKVFLGAKFREKEILLPIIVATLEILVDRDQDLM